MGTGESPGAGRRLRSFLAPGSYLGSRSGGSCRRSSCDTSHQLFRSHLVCSCLPGSSALPVPSPGGGPAGENSHILTTALRPSKLGNLPGAQQE